MKKTLLFLTAVLCFSTLLGQRMNKILYFGHLYVESGINVSDISPIIQLKPIVGEIMPTAYWGSTTWAAKSSRSTI